MALTAGRKAEIAQELRVASTWVAGPRQEKLLALALELEGADSPEDKAQEELAAERENALPDQPAKATKKAAKKAASQ